MSFKSPPDNVAKIEMNPSIERLPSDAQTSNIDMPQCTTNGVRLLRNNFCHIEPSLKAEIGFHFPPRDLLSEQAALRRS